MHACIGLVPEHCEQRVTGPVAPSCQRVTGNDAQSVRRHSCIHTPAVAPPCGLNPTVLFLSSTK
jgi:hypothetical protein